MRARRFALPKFLASVSSRTLRAPPFPSTYTLLRFLANVCERACMWVSVLRAKVKPVAGVVEVGRIRVTDQRAPREPMLGKSLRRLRRGPRVSSRARIASKTRACTRLSACLFIFLRSSLSVLLSCRTILLSFPRAFLRPSLFMIVLPFPSLRTILRACTVFYPLPLFTCYAFYHILCLLLLAFLPPLLNSFSRFSSHPTVQFPFRCTRLLPA